ncbi:hypothetical protein BDM02DRAFT_3182174 [Thelephora ganbajun]|uniref:Uncharacterized protein n=1 Tax=Thelephora ganbajun TaxID=370292 RepID=A0ACB6ZY40_THEGA|nr:hypothetical protein BDM02DRAFT_3182174 [Thelephora ganbajun]
MRLSYFWFLIFSLLASVSPVLSLSLPYSDGSPTLQRRTTPYFPPDPPSCPICEKDYWNINSCAQACPVLANISMVIFNPGAFIDVMKCACTDTFRSAFPQCVDCFGRTNQTWVYGQDNSLPSVVKNLRDICAFASTILGHVASANSELPSSTSDPLPTSTSNGGSHPEYSMQVTFVATVVLLSILGL